MSNYATIDLETSIKNRGPDAIGKNKASPFHKDNKICYLGAKVGREYTDTQFSKTELNIKDEIKLLVGANIKFDLLYLMRDYEDLREWLKTGKIWDIQLAEYLLTGQASKWASLDTMAVKYGGVVKDDRLKEFWNAGVDTEDIDEDIIKPYLKGDVENTELVFKHQVALSKHMDMLPLMWEQMDALLATTEMEFNGMHFDKEDCVKDARIIGEKVDNLRAVLNSRIADALSIDLADANCGSVDQISKTLFGGTVKETYTEDVLNDDGTPYRYKSGLKKGQIKTVLKSRDRRAAGFGFSASASWTTKKAGVFKVNDDVLKALLNGQLLTTITQEFIETLMEFRKLNKDLKTYYIGYSDLVWPDSKIHPQFNHCATATGRLSHSAPNLGNVSHAKDD